MILGTRERCRGVWIAVAAGRSFRVRTRLGAEREMSRGGLPMAATKGDPSKRVGVFLDRDGVLIRAIVRDQRPHSPTCAAEVEIPPDVPDACAELRRRGFVIVVVTNQPEVARGNLSREAVEEIHRYLQGRIPLDGIRVCYHDDVDHCTCRKPSPGMLCDAARDWNIDLRNSFLIGDRWKDIEAGKRAGCRTVFIDRQYAEPLPQNADFFAPSFSLAVEWVISQSEAASLPSD